jgi:hypothetical protein
MEYFMSKERQLSELKQEIQFLAIEKESCITGIEFSLKTSDWLHIVKCGKRLVEIEGLLNQKGESLLILSYEVAEEQRLSVLELIS